MKEGECNARFFQKEMENHRKHNRIYSLKNVEGQCIMEHEEVEGLLVNHFKDLLMENRPNREEVSHSKNHSVNSQEDNRRSEQGTD